MIERLRRKKRFESRKQVSGLRDLADRLGKAFARLTMKFLVYRLMR